MDPLGKRFGGTGPIADINDFRGNFMFLSNFYEVPVSYNGLTFKSNEAAFQAQKTLNDEERAKFTALNPSEAKRLGRRVALRDDWEYVKIQIMYEICHAKFEQHPDLAQRLVETGDRTLIEGNNWNDTFWGICHGKGENNLGIILMRIRDELTRRQNV